MAPVGLVFVGGVGLIGVLVTGLGARELWFAWRVYRGEPRPVYELPSETGPTAVQGVARPDTGTVEAPISGAATLICEWEVRERRASGGKYDRTDWKTLDEGLVGGPFRLEDETASCRVEPAGSVRTLEEHSVSVPAGTTPPERIQEFIAANHDVTPQDGSIDLGITELNVGNEQRFVERRLDPGEDCFVYGRARYDAAAGSRGGEVNVTIDGSDVRRFVVADRRDRGVAWDVTKLGIVASVIGLGLLTVAVVPLVGP